SPPGSPATPAVLLDNSAPLVARGRLATPPPATPLPTASASTPTAPPAPPLADTPAAIPHNPHTGWAAPATVIPSLPHTPRTTLLTPAPTLPPTTHRSQCGARSTAIRVLLLPVAAASPSTSAPAPNQTGYSLLLSPAARSPALSPALRSTRLSVIQPQHRLPPPASRALLLPQTLFAVSRADARSLSDFLAALPRSAALSASLKGRLNEEALRGSLKEIVQPPFQLHCPIHVVRWALGLQLLKKPQALLGKRQRRLQQLETESPAYNVNGAVKLK